VFAVDTKKADLTMLHRIRPGRRILIGEEKTGGNGTGGVNELGLEIARANGDRIGDAVGKAEKFLETDALLLIASSSGGTGSGAIAVTTKNLKERFPDKVIYNMIVTPFDEETAVEKAVSNTAGCLKSAYSVANAVFLVDNQRFATKGLTLTENALEINQTIIEPFYELLAAGEEKTVSHIGAKTVDAGDLIQTLTGWTVIGQGKTRFTRLLSFTLPLIDRIPFIKATSDFRDKFSEINSGIQLLTTAMSELSCRCNPADARKTLYLLAAPSQAMGLNLFALIGNALREKTPDAILRSGDYPRRRDNMSVTVLFSELEKIGKVTDFYYKAVNRESPKPEVSSTPRELTGETQS
jgi:cell division GTPase FtsZ